MNRKGQGAFEYVLLLAGVLLIVVLAVVLLRGGLFTPASNNAQVQTCVNTIAGLTGQTAVIQKNTASYSGCYGSNGVWNSSAEIASNATLGAACTTALAAEPGAGHECPATDLQCTGFMCGPKPG